MPKYKIYFLDRDELEDASEYEEFNAYWAVKKFLMETYDNCDGWDWMPKDNAETIVRTVAEDGKIEDFTWELEYEPSFFVSEKSE